MFMYPPDLLQVLVSAGSSIRRISEVLYKKATELYLESGVHRINCRKRIILHEDQRVGQGKLFWGLFPLSAPLISVKTDLERDVCLRLRICGCSLRTTCVSMQPTTQRIIHMLPGQRTTVRPSKNELKRRDYDSLPA